MRSPPIHLPISVQIHIDSALGISYTVARFTNMIQWLTSGSTKTNHLNHTTLKQDKNLQPNKQMQPQIKTPT